MAAVHCFGISNHSPDQILCALKKLKLIAADTEVFVPAPGMQFKKLRAKFIFFLDPGDFKRNITTLNAMGENVSVFVFASPLKLDTLIGIHKLDSVPESGFKNHGHVMSKLDTQLLKSVLHLPPVKIAKSSTDFLKTLIDKVIKGSLLNPLMTFIYTLPSATHQGPVKVAVVKWLLANKPISQLDSYLDSLGGIIISPKAKEKLKLILSTDICNKFKLAASDYQKTHDEKCLDAICSKYDVDPYEIRYLFSVLASSLPKEPKHRKLRRIENGDKPKQRAH